MQGTIYRLNVKPEILGERGLPKLAVESVEVRREGVVGDFNRLRHEKKGDNPDRALLLMTLEMIKQFNREGFPVEPGDLGENILTRGIPYVCYDVGKQYRIGEDVVIEISEPCIPCKHLAVLDYVGARKVEKFIETTLGRTANQNNP